MPGSTDFTEAPATDKTVKNTFVKNDISFKPGGVEFLS